MRPLRGSVAAVQEPIVKRAELEKLQGKKIDSRMRHEEIPERYGQGAAAVFDRREQRKRDQAAGLVPFAVKLEGGLVTELQALAQSRGVALNELVAELLRKALLPAGR